MECKELILLLPVKCYVVGILIIDSVNMVFIMRQLKRPSVMYCRRTDDMLSAMGEGSCGRTGAAGGDSCSATAVMPCLHR